MGAVTLSGVAKRYGGTEVLRDINLSIEEGEFAILVGPSGCGKSTLLRMIAGLEEISGGDISIGGRRVNDLEPKDRDIAMVFQSYALYPHMTVADNMGFALKMARVDPAEKQARITRAAEMLGLTPYLDRYPRALSGGQRQRVAMGRAMVRDPAVFLFDEPLSNLDAKLRVQMRSEIRQTQARLGVTTVYVTHDQIEAMTMADRIIVMNGGRIEQVGTPLDLYDRPANRFVAEFIGSPAMNMIAVTDGRLPDGTALPLIAPSGAVTVGLRPEHLHPGPAGISVQVTGVEPTGAETLITATLAGQPITAALRDRVTVRPGDSLTLGFDPAHLHLFDAVSGQRISR